MSGLLLRRWCGDGLGFLLGRRSLGTVAPEQPRRRELAQLVPHHVLRHVHRDELVPVVHREGVADEIGRDGAAPRPGRSEEHTSELQSRQYLVCRLLLEKKKKKK